jgi:hypothetical protein
VKHQGEGRQTVIDTGIYSVVRHPVRKGSGQFSDHVELGMNIIIPSTGSCRVLPSNTHRTQSD